MEYLKFLKVGLIFSESKSIYNFLSLEASLGAPPL